jgi:hypothetical protein
MKFLNGIFSQGFGHKLESSQTRVFVWFSTFFLAIYKVLYMNRGQFSCFTDLFLRILKTREEFGCL